MSLPDEGTGDGNRMPAIEQPDTAATPTPREETQVENAQEAGWRES